jgi:predicted GIY-YIG superfamily endonuclease
MSYTMGEGSMWCPCYALLPAQGCVELRTITKMEPLNEAAVRHEESIRKMKKYWEEKEIAEREARERAQAYNDSWGWSTCA